MTISFTVTANENDWDNALGGWRCPAIVIPSAALEAVFVDGEKKDIGGFDVLSEHRVIRWIGDNRPETVTFSIVITKDLTTEELTIKWKKLAIVLPLLASLLIGLGVPLGQGLFQNGELAGNNKDEERLLDKVKFFVRTGTDGKAGTNATVKILINNEPYTLTSGSGEPFSRNGSGETAPIPLDISYGQLKNATMVLAHDDKTKNGEGGSWQIEEFTMRVLFKGDQNYNKYQTWDNIGWLSNRARPRQVAAYALQ
uniref:Uncharacterized protein n=1 Tax=Candidatus Kentrum sp. LFY TaxID=2126342 RepID=A0A450UKY4_9GAMM|nr:MAG: hypothetical protein BECKLFY1418B_GA0070995_104229 [Candidatus Kentron sp. LFY]